MIGLVTAYDSDDSENSPKPSPRQSPTSTVETVTVTTSVTVVVQKTIQRSSTSNSLINYGSDSDDEEVAATPVPSSTDGTLEIRPPTPQDRTKKISKLRLMRLLPPEPLGQANPEIQEKVSNYLKVGKSYNAQLQAMKNFHNPYILKKLAERYGINQSASNYPPELYDPQEWEKEDFEKLARQQENRMREKAQQEEKQFVMPAVPTLVSSSSGPGLRRWDSQPALKKAKSTAQIQQVVQIANQLKQSLGSGAIDAAAAAKKEAAARAAVLSLSKKTA